MAVHLNGVPSEGLPSRRVGFEIMLQDSRTALSKPIDVDGDTKIFEPALARNFRRLPDRALGCFAIAQQDVNAIALVLEFMKVDRQTNPCTDSLSKGSSSNIYEGKARRGMSF